MATGKWLKISLGLIAVFAAGALTGSLLTFHFGHHGPPWRMGMDVPKLSQRVLKHLDAELKLSADQMEKIRPIIVESLQKQQAIHEQSRSQIVATREDSRSKIMPLLDSDQQARLQELDKKWKNRLQNEDGSH